MRDEKGFFARVFTPGTPECAIVCALLGVLTALLLLWAGFWKTLLVAGLVALGAFLGGVKDKAAWFRRLIGRLDRD